jgi:protein gp37
MPKKKTKIEWCDYTLNCFWGCYGGCPYCAARKIARRFGRYIGEKRGYPPSIIPKMANFEPVFLPDQLAGVSGIKEYSQIFISEMGDWCGTGVSPADSQQALDTMWIYPQHDFITSTKQPQNLGRFEYPPNCWMGIGVTDRKSAERALTIFEKLKASIRYLMAEPLLGPPGKLDLTGINLVIIGSQTNPYRPPELKWVEELVEAADRAGTAVFIKENLKSLLKPFILESGIGKFGFPIYAKTPYVKLRQELRVASYAPVIR